MRLSGWVVLSTMFASTNKARFVEWLAKKLLPRLKRGDVLVLDNLSTHHDPRVVPSGDQWGQRLDFARCHRRRSLTNL